MLSCAVARARPERRDGLAIGTAADDRQLVIPYARLHGGHRMNQAVDALPRLHPPDIEHVTPIGGHHLGLNIRLAGDQGTLAPSHTDNVTWWQPLIFYLIAAVLRGAPFSEWSVRLPIACLAILDIWLIYAVARRLFSNAWYGVLAALMLAITPAHFIFGRQAMDYFCPVPFALAWLWCLLLCVQSEAAWLPGATVQNRPQPPQLPSATRCTSQPLAGLPSQSP